MTAVYVASDQPRAGKTALCVTLADEQRRQGKKAAVFKPLASATGKAPDLDPDIYETLLGQPRGDWPFALLGWGLTDELLDEVRSAYTRVSDGVDVLLIEAPAHISNEDSRRLVEALDAVVLQVVRFQPGMDVSSLASWRELYGDRLVGYLVNGMTRYQGTEVRTRLLPSMSSEGLDVLGVVPEDRRLLAFSVGRIAADLGGRFLLGNGAEDGLVEHFLVGGLGLDSGALYFGIRENKAAVVRGDRPDLQMAALQTPTACMVLTNGIEPIEYVMNEAELEEVPLILVEGSTLETMDTLGSITQTPQFDSPEKVRRLSDLLDEHVDREALSTALGR